MKLLIDQNLSPKLVGRLVDLFPGSIHVQTAGLDCSSDDEVWEFARINDYTIVSKDEDYSQLSTLRGLPPKVLWLLLGNSTTSQVESLIRLRIADIISFEADNSVGTLAIG